MSLSKHSAFVHALLYPSGDLEIRLKGCQDPVAVEKQGRGKRKEITELSNQSAKRGLTTFRALAHHMVATITLTYPAELVGELDGRESKKHLERFIRWVQWEFGKDVVYAWVLEFQKNGNPHYHLMLDRFVPAQAVAERWYTIVGSELEKHLKAGTRVEAIRSKIAVADYLARYLTKMHQKDVPEGFKHVGRFWGYKRGAAKPVYDAHLAFDTPDDATRGIREIRKARKASLRRFLTKKGKPIKWKWRGKGFVDRSMGFDLAAQLIERMPGLPVRGDGADLAGEVPW